MADLRTLTNFDIDDPLMNTIGGVTLVLFGRLPRVGEKVFYADYEITVREVVGMRITKVRVTRGRTPDEPEETPEEPEEIESIAAPLPDVSAEDQEQQAQEEYEEADLLHEAPPEETEAEQEQPLAGAATTGEGAVEGDGAGSAAPDGAARTTG